MIKTPELLSVEQVNKLQLTEVTEFFIKYASPGQYRAMKLLGFHKVLIRKAKGAYYFDDQGRKILDFFGSFGAIPLGHNHQRIINVRREFQQENRHEMAMVFMSQYATALCKNLATIAPDDLDMVMLSTSGSEAVEAALKLAEQYQGKARSTVVYASHSFHGKTRGALSITDSILYQSKFQLIPNKVVIPFGDITAFRAVTERDPSIGSVIFETIQGGAGVITPPKSYFRDIRQICDEKKIIWIADEVQCGYGRTGRFFAFEHYDVLPDIVVLAKGLGGGKAAIGTAIARKKIYMDAYGTSKTALIHGPSTFSGMGEACCTAIESLNVLYDEKLINNAALQGELLFEKLTQLKDQYPHFVKEIRGKGLMIGVEFHDISRTLPVGVKHIVSPLDDKLKGSLCGFVCSLLLKEHNILVGLTEYNRNVMRLAPPLIISAKEINNLIESLKDIFGLGVSKIIAKYAGYFLKDSLKE